jgi:hypothetical protein
MSLTFLAYAEEDHFYVQELASHLAERDIPTWYYGRDSILGIPYTDQIAEAFSRASFVVVIVSVHSVHSHQVKREAEQAHQRNLPILPILHGISSAEVRTLQPGLAQIFGTSVHGNTTHDGLATLADRIKVAFNRLLPGPAPRPQPTHAWATDSKDIDIAVLEQVLFRTEEIQSFLASDHQFFVSANKGLGKTLLLRSKRARLTQEFKHSRPNETRPAVCLIPENRPYLDLMGASLPTLSKSHLNMLGTLEEVKRLWSFAIRLSAISHFPDIAGQLDQEVLNKLTKTPILMLTKARVAPSVILQALLSLPVTNLNRLLDGFEHQLNYLFHSLHSGAILFIDRVEMGFSHLPQQVWMHLQAGLIEAAWDVMNANNHVKVYASIREEAYANYESDSKPNLHSATLALRYTVDELRSMLDRLSQFYEGAPSFTSFIGLDRVGNPRCRVEEDAFRYLHRHTLGRPRDLVIVCCDLTKKRSQISEDVYCDIVNASSSRHVVRSIFSEMQVFLDALSQEADRQRFFRLLPYNILTRADVEAICCEFNGLTPNSLGGFEECPEKIQHPFCELYCCGLIGLVTQNAGHGRLTQRFKQPHDTLRIGASCLPTAEYYLLHPSLQTLVDEHRAQGYRPFRYVVVGHDYAWERYYPALISVQRALWELPDTGLAGRILDRIGGVCCELNSGQTPALEHLEQALKTLERHNFDDAYLALDSFCSVVSQGSG